LLRSFIVNQWWAFGFQFPRSLAISAILAISSDPALSAMALLELLNHVIEIGITRAETSGKPVSAPLRHSLVIRQHFKLARLARRYHCINAQPFFNQGHETRDLGFVVLSRRAGTYLNFHSVLHTKFFFPESVLWCFQPGLSLLGTERDGKAEPASRRSVDALLAAHPKHVSLPIDS
jgi:hypothetical protein